MENLPTDNLSLGNLSEKVSDGFNLESLTSNPMVYGVLAIFLTVYGPRLSPKLPTPIRTLFNNKYFRFLIILLVTYLSSKNLQLALIVSIAFCLITSYTESQEIQDNFANEMRENFSDFDTIRELNNTTKETFIVDPKGEVFADNDDASQNGSAPLDAPAVCSGGLTQDQCIQFCYGEAGKPNAWCQKKFPNPQKSQCRGKTGENILKCIKSECKENSVPGTYCHEINKSGPSAQGNNGLARIEEIIELIFKELDF